MSRLAAPAAVAVVGAGTMGAGIAQVAALAGHPVLLHDTAAGRADEAVTAIGAALDRLADRGRLDPAAARAARARVTTAPSLADLHAAALVVEAVAEQLDVKRHLLGGLEDVVAEDAVLGTNTSSLSVTDVAAGLRYPGRCVGTHFFNPAPVMRLVEVVRGARTDPAVVAEVSELMAAWGKTPVPVRSAPGFVVNRVARPFYGEGMRLLASGVAPSTVDAVLREAGGFPMGPLELADLIGHDVNLATTRSVWEQTGRDPRFTPSTAQVSLVACGRLGRKSGRGFYRYPEGPPPPDPTPAASAPARVRVRGDWGPWAPLWERVRRAGVEVVVDDPTGEPVARVGDGDLVPTDGRTAAEHEARSGRPTAVLDLVADAATARRWAVGVPEAGRTALRDSVVGLLAATGAEVSVLPDVPGLLVARTVALLVDEACDVVAHDVATPEDVDTAMRLGAGYPFGPLEWGDRIGPGRVAALLDALSPGSPRHRVCRALRDAVAAGASLHGRREAVA
ncbi:3-hydroxyacyl-CoA dehydrogenase [Cellulomonas carbonis]|uniref:3-hydroxyacyl-CoA dehydrogenase n=1 Tax=Cellulomonas carbonis T26 TaxID=947969 RepID=A0A0A0BWY3_9CELL|nr:3-hydroxyacyl-CoA dehydrogenase [Cellulomonas carbonis]KGM12177.1 3-hydroxyacyl-CoA dehydrogenase [Cellulomonas carbonis T26]GGB96101.1 3-hydroxyacyl-CoA dehydrogenase [Cellulomonas carbonis]